MNSKSLLLLFTLFLAAISCDRPVPAPPNIVIIYTDDVGYGDIGCYGSNEVQTPHIDRLAAQGIRFTNAYATASTCTPSRYGLLTGEYHWRKPPGWSVGAIKGVSIAPGDAGLIIDPALPTLPRLLKGAGYATAVVGKWHLGLGPAGGPDWNGLVTPGAAAVGFDYSYLLPVTGDRVPCVFLENGRVEGLDPNDPIAVSYKQPIGPDSLIYNPAITPDSIVTYDIAYAKEQREERDLKMVPSFGHDQRIVNGIPRIGYMMGGAAALWKDEEIAERITDRALRFIDENRDHPFFLYFSTHDIHVPRVPSGRFAGKSPLGVYGDVVMQMDWCVGQVMERLEALGLAENTLVIFSSDNGPVYNDGYFDGTDAIAERHRATGPYSGGKYSALEGGTRVPFIVRWPARITPGVSDALFSQIDLLATLAALTGYDKPDTLAVDSYNHLPVLLGEDAGGRDFIVQQNMGGALSIIKKGMKYIEPGDGPAFNPYTNPPVAMGNSPIPQLYDLTPDGAEERNIAGDHPAMVRQLADTLQIIKNRKRYDQ